MMSKERDVAIRNGAVSFRVLSGGKGHPIVYFQSVFDRKPWSPFVEALARHYQVFVPLLPGAQGSTGLEAISDVVDLTLAHEELLDALDLDQVSVVGHSLGGLFAAELASIFPARCRRVVLVAPYGLWVDELPSPDMLILPPEDLEGVLWRDTGSKAARQWAELPVDETARLSQQFDDIQRRASASKFIWPLPDAGTGKRLHRVESPMLLMWGDHDSANPSGYADVWKGQVPSAVVHTMPGGHMVLEESPGETCDVVRQFLGKN